jgi:hypothetical protein
LALAVGSDEVALGPIVAILSSPARFSKSKRLIVCPLAAGTVKSKAMIVLCNFFIMPIA